MQFFTERKQNNEGSVSPVRGGFSDSMVLDDSGSMIGPTFTDFEWILKIAIIKLASHPQHPAHHG